MKLQSRYPLGSQAIWPQHNHRLLLPSNHVIRARRIPWKLMIFVPASVACFPSTMQVLKLHETGRMRGNSIPICNRNTNRNLTRLQVSPKFIVIASPGFSISIPTWTSPKSLNTCPEFQLLRRLGSFCRPMISYLWPKFDRKVNPWPPLSLQLPSLWKTRAPEMHGHRCEPSVSSV